MKENWKRIFQVLFFCLGLFLFYATLQKAGWESLGMILPVLRGSGLLFLAVYPFMSLWDALGWRAVFAVEIRNKISFSKIFFIRLVGQAVNYITPLIDIGGEFVKVPLAAKHFGVSKETASVSVIISRSILFFSEVLFWLVGLGAAYFLVNVPELRQKGVFIGLAVFAALCVVLFLIQRKGVFAALKTGLERLGFKVKGLSADNASLEAMDAEMTAFYSCRDSRFAVSFVFHFLGWLAGGVEMYVFFHILGTPISLFQGIMLEALLQLTRTLSFFIPGSLGAQEAGLAIVVHAMGLPASLGVAVSLLKRLRQSFWALIGFGAWGVLSVEKKSSVLDTDTPLDCVIHRPPAEALSVLFAKTPVTPNHLTVTALALALVSAWLFSSGVFWRALVGLLFFYLWAVLDHTDGMLARRTGKSSEFGRRLDDLCDVAASSAILCGIFIGAFHFIPGDSKAYLTALFVPGLVLNGFFGTKVVDTKTRVRRYRVKRNKLGTGFVMSQNVLDHFTGREPFYLLLMLALISFYYKFPWVQFLLYVMIGGCYAFALGYFIVEKLLRRRFGPSRPARIRLEKDLSVE